MNVASRTQRTRKDFPFVFAFFAALVLHLLLGVAIKRNALIAGNPVPPVRSDQPVTMRFVEVPPESKTVPQAPKTNNVSDANRKAGPLKRLKAGEMRMPSRPGKPGPPVIRERPQVVREKPVESPPQQMAQVAPPSTSAPPIPVSPSPENDANSIPLNPNPGNQKQLSAALQDLDQYIRNNDSGDGGIYSPKEGSPSGDTGSGAFFDTQGFDLGPWGNRVVAIVKKNWIVPVAAELGLKGIVSISFEVEKRTGNFINMNVISSSNIPSFDQAALNALKSSNPLPPLPADFPRPTLPGVFRFYYNIPIEN
jgi:TonB family protein